MNGKQIMVGQSQWTFPDGDVVATLGQIKTALQDGSMAELSLIGGDNHQVTVYLNGKTTATVVIDLDVAPRPTEISVPLQGDAQTITVGQSQWTFPDGDVAATLGQIETALQDGSLAELSLIDGDKRPVTVYLNGKAAEMVVIDLGGSPRPTEIS